jgi:hypothetical protein
MDDGGWDPYEVWYTRVLLPRQRAEIALGQSRGTAVREAAAHASAAVPPQDGAITAFRTETFGSARP